MKTLKACLLIAIFSVTFFTAQAGVEPVTTTDDLQSQLSEIILDSEAFENLEESTSFKVKLMITSDSQVLVLNTSDEKFDDKVKSLLNYAELEVSSEMHGKTFVLPVRIEKQ